MSQRLSTFHLSGLKGALSKLPPFIQKSSQSETEILLNAFPETIRVLPISAHSRSQLFARMRNLPSPYIHFQKHCDASKAAILSQLSSTQLAVIRDFQFNPLAPGTLVITGLPLDSPLPGTPLDGGRSREKESSVSEGCLAGIASIMGQPFGYRSEKNGAMIHNICPIQHSETEQSNASSKTDLSLHVENAYFDFRPDFLLLYCLRQDPKNEAQTLVVDIRSVLAKIDPRLRVELQKPVFVVPSPPSHHRAMGGEKWSPPRPIFENLQVDPNFICHFPGIKALDSTAQKALDRFEEVAYEDDVTSRIALQPGSILLLNNRKVAHGRSSFEAHYDGMDRWLQRMYVTETRTHKGGRYPADIIIHTP